LWNNVANKRMLDSRSCFLLFSATSCLSILRAFVVQTLPRVRVRRQRFFFLLCVSLLLPLLYSVSCLLTGCQRRINQTLKKTRRHHRPEKQTIWLRTYIPIQSKTGSYYKQKKNFFVRLFFPEVLRETSSDDAHILVNMS
jgi:hypothetical protein